MTEPLEGWYWATNNFGKPRPVEVKKVLGKCFVHAGDNIIGLGTSLDPGWTLGPRIDDLLRDASSLKDEAIPQIKTMQDFIAARGLWDEFDAAIRRERVAEPGVDA